MPAAARVGDHHTCPKSEPGPVPHVGGAILPSGCPTVLIHEMPAARVGDRSKCNGPPDTIVMGEPSVLIANMPAARVGDPTSHGGVIVAGCGCVQIGQVAQAIVMREAAKSGAGFCEECARKKAEGDAKKRRKKGAKKSARKASAKPATLPTPHGGRMGALSRAHEGGAGLATISPRHSGDAGGSSYGPWQLATNTGTAREFVNGLKLAHPDYYERFKGLSPSTDAFDAAWRQLAKDDPTGFEGAQYDFIRSTHYDPQIERIRERYPSFDVDQRSGTLREVLWSTAVQQRGLTPRIFERALGGADPSTLTDEEIIRRVYPERGADDGRRYFSRCSPKVQHQQVTRYAAEEREALDMLARERQGR